MAAPDPSLQLWLAQALGKQVMGNWTGALLGFRRILSRDPEHLAAWCGLTLALHHLDQPEEAQAAAAKALALGPNHAAAHCNQGILLRARQDAPGALAALGRALSLDPDHVPALSELAATLNQLGHLDQALAADRRALELEPGTADLHLNLGYSLLRAGALNEAETAFERCLQLQPGHPKGRWNLAYARLLQGRYREAWPDFLARLEIPEARDNQRGFPEPRWTGQPFPGQTLLVWVEQGLGDTLQFLRYLPLVKARGGRVLFQIYPELRDLLAVPAGADQVLTVAEPLPPFDLQVALLDLPALFDHGLEDLPRTVPYLAGPDPAHYQPGPALLAGLANPDRWTQVALVWAGNPRHLDDARRSLDPALLAPLAALPGVRWISLQTRAQALPPLPGLVDLGPHLADFRDTAYALEHCDLVISVDTAVAHLAGAMAVPGLLLLPYLPDWRWLMTGPDCPWYPTLRVYRQPAPGAWPEVFAALVEDLR